VANVSTRPSLPPFVPDDFEVPLQHTYKELSLIKLVPEMVASDYEAVMGSRVSSRLSTVFAADDIWPTASMTVEEDLLDLQRHAIEFDLRLAFAYTIVRNDDTAMPQRTLGCVYINPATRINYEAEVFWWSVSHGGSSTTLAAEVEDLVRSWIAEAWPFKAVAYPGRDPTWAAFEQVPHREEAVPRIDESAQTVVRAAWRSCGLARQSRETKLP
jgi:hypothetical protein